jgi:hypothetical protein
MFVGNAQNPFSPEVSDLVQQRHKYVLNQARSTERGSRAQQRGFQSVGVQVFHRGQTGMEMGLGDGFFYPHPDPLPGRGYCGLICHDQGGQPLGGQVCDLTDTPPSQDRSP